MQIRLSAARDNWAFEIKFDGYRCIAVKGGRQVMLFSRHRNVLNKRFPGVMDALASLDGDFALDGELVALDSQGKPSFQLLQHSLSQSRPIYFYAFDLLNRNGEVLVHLPLSHRRELLESLLVDPKDLLRLSPILQASSVQVLKAVRKLGLEGCRRETNRFHLRTRRAIWRLDQAPCEPGAGVRHWRLHHRNTCVRCIACGCLREEGTHFRGEGEERVWAAHS